MNTFFKAFTIQEDNEGAFTSSIKRKDLDKVITISSNVISGYNPTNVNSKINLALS